MRLPEGWVRTAQGGIEIVTHRESLDFVAGAVRTAGSLYAYAAAQPGAQPLQGRGTAWAFPAPASWWVVRHSQRGGAMRWLRDRYVRIGTPRPLRELSASEAARARNIDTPQILAVVVYEAGAFVRADIATRYIAQSADLAALTLGASAWPSEERRQAWSAAGTLVRTSLARGVVHADLNLKNVLIERTPGLPRAWLLDLDRCRITERASESERARVVARFHRSRAKLERAIGRTVGDQELAAFEKALGE